VSEALVRTDERVELFGSDAERDDTPLPVVIEINLLHRNGLSAAEEALRDLLRDVLGDDDPWRVAKTYYKSRITMRQVRELVAEDRRRHPEAQERAIYRVWPDFPVKPLIDRSVVTVKADAAHKAYSALGAGITWAVIDSGIDASHPHFRRYKNLEHEDVIGLHRDFTSKEESSKSALVDDLGHGTHVAGIIAGGLPPAWPEEKLLVLRNERDETDQPVLRTRKVQPELLAGVAPRCRLVSLKALSADGSGDSTGVMRALEYIREVNGEGKLMRIHGVNLSVGYEFKARWFACGQSPLCVEVDRLVRSGVVVVVAAGNTGYGTSRALSGITPSGLPVTINDPGNAEQAITVGATHRDMPHTYGVSYFSSKGPTGDGRMKPDLVAPGENITSCAAGAKREQMAAWSGAKTPLPPLDELATYIDDSGTSMAAPHVSGVIAAFLSIRQEFIGQPEVVKRIFLDTATSLGRVEQFQGKGLVDLMRAIQSV
jgi:subtilisin family serine protease